MKINPLHSQRIEEEKMRKNKKNKKKTRHVNNDIDNIVIIGNTHPALLLDLSYDILHSLLEEWLEWRDIVNMDHACLGSCRPVWLSIVAGIRFPVPLNEEVIGGILSSSYYRWCQLRHIISRTILLDLTKIEEDLLWLVDEGLCDQIQNLILGVSNSSRRITNENTKEEEEVEGKDDNNRLSQQLGHFLDHCIHLKGLYYLTDTFLFNVIASHVKGLTCIQVFKMPVTDDDDGIIHFLSNYRSTLKELSIMEECEFTLHNMLTIVNNSSLTLHELCLSVGDNSQSSDVKDLLISYLTSFGKELERLRLFNLCKKEIRVTRDLIKSIFNLCPSLSSLELIPIQDDDDDDDEEEEEEEEQEQLSISFDFLSEIFRSYPKLTDFRTSDVSLSATFHGRESIVYFRYYGWSFSPQDSILFLHEHFMKKSYLIAVYLPNCILDESKVRLIIDELGPLLTILSCCCPSITDDLFSYIMEECYNLTGLTISNEDYDCSLSDEALLSIIPCGKNLLILSLSFARYFPLFSDEKLSKVLTTCKDLMHVNLPYAGVASLQAVMRLPLLTKFTFSHVHAIHFDVMERFLHDKRYRWPKDLTSGQIVFRNGSTLQISEQKKYTHNHPFTILKKKGSNRTYYLIQGEEGESFG